MTADNQYLQFPLAREIQFLVPGLLALGTAACLISAEERIIEVNQSNLDLTGSLAEEVVATCVHDPVTAVGDEVAKLHFELALKRGKSISFTRLSRNPQGQQQWIAVAYFPVHAVNRELPVVLAQILLVKNADGVDDVFVERERLLRHLIDDAGRPILYLDRELVLRFINKPFQEWIGNPDPNILGQQVSNVLPKPAYDFYAPSVHRCLCRRSATNGRPVSGNAQHTTPCSHAVYA